MMTKLIKEVTIKLHDDSQRGEILSSIHNQLVGNQDYIDNNIVLHDSDCMVSLFIFSECKEIPKIII